MLGRLLQDPLNAAAVVTPISHGPPRRSYSSRSFERLEPAPSTPLARGRASTLQPGSVFDSVYAADAGLSPESVNDVVAEDVFQDDHKASRAGAAGRHSPGLSIAPSAAYAAMEELPVELLSLSDR